MDASSVRDRCLQEGYTTTNQANRRQSLNGLTRGEVLFGCQNLLNVQPWHWKSFRSHLTTLSVIQHNKHLLAVRSPTLIYVSDSSSLILQQLNSHKISRAILTLERVFIRHHNKPAGSTEWWRKKLYFSVRIHSIMLSNTTIRGCQWLKQELLEDVQTVLAQRVTMPTFCGFVPHSILDQFHKKFVHVERSVSYPWIRGTVSKGFTSQCFRTPPDPKALQNAKRNPPDPPGKTPWEPQTVEEGTQTQDPFLQGWVALHSVPNGQIDCTIVA